MSNRTNATIETAQGLLLGDLLVKAGALTDEQRNTIVREQRDTPKPFGLIAEQRFGVDPKEVEAAWATQWAMWADRVDPTMCYPTPESFQVIERRQAWQFGIFPIRFESGNEENARELVAATTEEQVARALRFAGWKLDHAVRFVLADLESLTRALTIHYPIRGMQAITG